MALYKVFVPIQAVGANLVYFDLFAPTGGPRIDLVSLLPLVSGAVAVAGVVGVDLFLTRTSTVGTGGTAMVAEGASLSAMSLNALDNTQPFSLGFLSGRLTPTGGGAAAAVLGYRCVFGEETVSAAYLPIDFVTPGSPICLCSGMGIRVVQGSVASVGNIGFDAVIRV